MSFYSFFSGGFLETPLKKPEKELRKKETNKENLLF
jgi:hypothetical protein